MFFDFLYMPIVDYYLHHKIFHEKMVMAVLDSLNPQETKDLTKALLKLQRFFDDYGKE